MATHKDNRRQALTVAGHLFKAGTELGTLGLTLAGGPVTAPVAIALAVYKGLSGTLSVYKAGKGIHDMASTDVRRMPRPRRRNRPEPRPKPTESNNKDSADKEVDAFIGRFHSTMAKQPFLVGEGSQISFANVRAAGASDRITLSDEAAHDASPNRLRS